MRSASAIGDGWAGPPYPSIRIDQASAAATMRLSNRLHGLLAGELRAYLRTAVWVTDGKIALEIPEWRYVGRGYRPLIDELPWDKPTAETIDAQEAT